MSNPLLLDIALFLTSNGIVEGDGIDVFRDFTPESPDSVVILNEYSGDPTVPYVPLVHRSIQILSRDKNANIARQRALKIFMLLNTDDLIINFTPDRWGQVSARQPPFKIKQDDNGRVYYGFNVGITTTLE